MNDSQWSIIQADVFEWLESYEGPRFHAVLADPPYGINFMGKDWDNFRRARQQTDVPIYGNNQYYQRWVMEWASLLIERALYPGAVCLFFGGTRTWHRLACGLEDAGFEVSDTLMWLYGQGFPKGHDISQAIDRDAGVQREVVGMRKHPTLKDTSRVDRQKATQYHAANPIADEWPITEPSTEAARIWSGYNTALKPAWEPVILCRAPRGSHRYVDLVLKYGTGALWVDGCRISTNGMDRVRHLAEWDRVQSMAAKEGRVAMRGGLDTIKLDGYKNEGRWPANLMLSHLPGCEMVGQQRLKLPAPIKPHLISDDHLYGSGRKSGRGTVISNDGETEVVEVWKCVEGCPVSILGTQSAITKSSGGGGYRENGAASGIIYGQFGKMQYPHNVGKGDIGTAARFFYVAKSSTSERNAGLPSGKRNDHPTVKPLSITEYLAKLLLPPCLREPRRMLVPFSGSGSEVIGAWRAGWDQTIGVEINQDYTEIAQLRLNYHTLQPRLL